MCCEEHIQRDSITKQVTIPSGEALSDPINLREWAGMLVHMPPDWDAAYIGFKVASKVDGTYLPLKDEDGAYVLIGDTGVSTQPAVNEAYVAPADLWPARFVQLWSNDGAGSDINQTADRTLAIDLKG